MLLTCEVLGTFQSRQLGRWQLHKLAKYFPAIANVLYWLAMADIVGSLSVDTLRSRISRYPAIGVAHNTRHRPRKRLSLEVPSRCAGCDAQKPYLYICRTRSP